MQDLKTRVGLYQSLLNILYGTLHKKSLHSKSTEKGTDKMINADGVISEVNTFLRAEGYSALASNVDFQDSIAKIIDRNNFADQKAEVTEQMRGQVRTELQQSLRAEAIAQLKNDLRPEVTVQVKAELKDQLLQQVRRDIEIQERPGIVQMLKQEIRNDPSARAGMIDTLKTDLRPTVLNDLRQDLAGPVRAELKVELAPLIKAELIQEHRDKAAASDAAIVKSAIESNAVPTGEIQLKQPAKKSWFSRLVG